MYDFKTSSLPDLLGANGNVVVASNPTAYMGKQTTVEKSWPERPRLEQNDRESHQDRRRDDVSLVQRTLPRIEYQGRGAAHAHGCLRWKADEFNCSYPEYLVQGDFIQLMPVSTNSLK
jgi:hypothetical protein